MVEPGSVSPGVTPSTWSRAELGRHRGSGLSVEQQPRRVRAWWPEQLYRCWGQGSRICHTVCAAVPL